MKNMSKNINGKFNLYFIGDFHLPRGVKTLLNETIETIKKDNNCGVIGIVVGEIRVIRPVHKPIGFTWI